MIIKKRGVKIEHFWSKPQKQAFHCAKNRKICQPIRSGILIHSTHILILYKINGKKKVEKNMAFWLFRPFFAKLAPQGSFVEVCCSNSRIPDNTPTN